jgi:hypothetical protein
MFKNTIRLVLILTLFRNSLFAQPNQPLPICGYEIEVNKILEKNPDFLKWQDKIYQKASEENNNLNHNKRRILSDTEYYEIPVVFHIIYNNADQNLSDDVIMSQLIALNQDFRKQNADTSGIRSIFKSLASDTRIQFKLATTDPDGNLTNGITRTITNKNTFAVNRFGGYSEDMKKSNSGGKDAWNSLKYLNIWICNMNWGAGRFGIVYGFATPPTGAVNWDGTNATKDPNDPLSGVVLHYEAVGVNNPISPAGLKKGNTATHEVGHYLGLRHIWGDGTNQSGVNNCLQSDGIDDTPFARNSNSLCNPNTNTCTENNNDMPDMTENYMDYTIDACAAMFSKQQSFFMRYVLNNLRTELPLRKITFDTIPDFVKVILYPNPTTNNQSSNILIESPNKKETFVASLIDMNGKQLFDVNIQANAKTPIATQVLADGIYFVIVREKESGKIINKQKLQIN